MRTLGASHPGRVRTSNQDAYLCGKLAENTAFAVVCDGMGGANGGNIASSIAMRSMAERLVEDYRENATPEAVRELLESAVLEANGAVYRAAREEPDLYGMGTTAVAAIATPEAVYIAYAGDSRAYIITPRDIEQVTKDHSVVQDMVDKGQITQEEAKTHPQKHFLTRALGVEPDLECAFTRVAFPDNGTLLICTDGLSNLVAAEMIQSLVRTFAFQDIPMKLITTANLAGGSDNITVVAVTKN